MGVSNAVDGEGRLAINNTQRRWGFRGRGKGGSEHRAQLGHMECGVDFKEQGNWRW